MKTVPLGDTGVDVSAMCLGTMYFGTKEDEDTSRQLLDQYVEAGGTFLDTANCYSHWVEGGYGGESESLLGRWMAERKNRDQLFIATKVAFGYPGTDESPGVETGLSAAKIEAECEKSLKRMGIDTIDLYYAHHDDKATPLEELLEAFDRLIEAGKVRYIGASNYVAWRLADALNISASNSWARFQCVQQKHTYLRPVPGADVGVWPPAYPYFFDLCREKSITAIAYSPLLRGAYVRNDRPAGRMYAGADSDARMAALKELAGEKGVTANQAVFAWMMHCDPVVIPLFSVSSSEQLTEDLGALDVELNEEDMGRLDEASGILG
ncbi:aldo/keto reductase [Verrucomicrobiota bacterium]